MYKKLLFISILFLASQLFSYEGHQKWIGVYSQGLPYSDQKIIKDLSWDNVSDEIKKAWKEGFDVTQIKYGNGKWVAILSKGTGFTSNIVGLDSFKLAFLYKNIKLY